MIGQVVSSIPAGYKLYVEQGILTEKVKVALKSTSEWSDYVFKPGYKLHPLSEVEQYITKHKHLPGVPSAVEVVEKGGDVAKMDANLLAKIEELTLYSIQLEKELVVTKQQRQQDWNELQAMKQKQTELERLLHQLLEKK